jgi:Fur family transcriptional regulator, ferric uptake regulator
MPLPDAREAYAGGRLTPQRATVAAAVSALGGAFTVDDLASAVHAIDPGLGTATVYRAVGAMLASGWIERVGEREGSSLFAHCGQHAHEHHHHVVCDMCGRTDVTGCPVPESEQPSTPNGFLVTRHEVTFYGLCPTCAGRLEREGA